MEKNSGWPRFDDRDDQLGLRGSVEWSQRPPLGKPTLRSVCNNLLAVRQGIFPFLSSVVSVVAIQPSSPFSEMKILLSLG